jgi:hypothetical protein
MMRRHDCRRCEKIDCTLEPPYYAKGLVDLASQIEIRIEVFKTTRSQEYQGYEELSMLKKAVVHPNVVCHIRPPDT